MRSPSFATVAVGTVAAFGVLLLPRHPPTPEPRLKPTPRRTAAATPSAPTASTSLPLRAAAASSAPASPPADQKIAAAWNVPDANKLPDDIFGQTVRYGRNLITKPTLLIGPNAKDPATRFAGSGLVCQPCQLQGGTQQFGLPLAGTWGVFPVYIGRENNVRTSEDRINGCMEHSVNGHVPPPDGPEIKAIVTYIRHIKGREQVGMSLEGRGSPSLPLPAKAADPVHGQEVFKTVCAACHGVDGRGQRLDASDAVEQGKRYRCLVAEHCWDPVKLAITDYAYRFEQLQNAALGRS